MMASSKVNTPSSDPRYARTSRKPDRQEGGEPEVHHPPPHDGQASPAPAAREFRSGESRARERFNAVQAGLAWMSYPPLNGKGDRERRLLLLSGRSGAEMPVAPDRSQPFR